jgi:hypothetical protein
MILIVMVMITLIYQFKTYLFTCLFNSTKANYKVNRVKKRKQNTNKIQIEGNLYNFDNNDLVLYYLCAESTSTEQIIDSTQLRYW